MTLKPALKIGISLFLGLGVFSEGFSGIVAAIPAGHFIAAGQPDSLDPQPEERHSADSSLTGVSSPSVETGSYDRLITRAGDTLVIKIADINIYEVIFQYPLNYRKERMGKTEIAEIHFQDGKREIMAMANPVATSSSDKEWAVPVTEKDWERVITFTVAEDVKGFTELGKVVAHYEANKINASTEYMEKNALIILRKRTARLGGDVVLVTEKKEYRSFGELPSIDVSGIAYKKTE